jgi:hypothetical protein
MALALAPTRASPESEKNSRFKTTPMNCHDTITATCAKCGKPCSFQLTRKRTPTRQSVLRLWLCAVSALALLLATDPQRPTAETVLPASRMQMSKPAVMATIDAQRALRSVRGSRGYVGQHSTPRSVIVPSGFQSQRGPSYEGFALCELRGTKRAERVKTYISTCGLSQKLALAQLTVLRRMRDRGVEPDAIMLAGAKGPALLFDVDRLPALRAALANTVPTTEPAQ